MTISLTFVQKGQVVLLKTTTIGFAMYCCTSVSVGFPETGGIVDKYEVRNLLTGTGCFKPAHSALGLDKLQLVVPFTTIGL